MNELIKIIADNGIAIVCVAYLIYFQHTTMSNMIETLIVMKDDIKELKTDVRNLKK